MKCPMKLKHANEPDSKFIAKELKMGIQSEMEHTNNKTCAKAIAKAHLNERSNYYTLLRRYRL